MKSLKDRNVCCCKYHVKLDFLKVGFNYLENTKKRTSNLRNLNKTKQKV